MKNLTENKGLEVLESLTYDREEFQNDKICKGGIFFFLEGIFEIITENFPESMKDISHGFRQ